MEQSTLFGFILSVIERRLAAYFGELLDEKEKNNDLETKEIYSEGILPSYSSDDSFEKGKDYTMDTTDFNQSKYVKIGKVKPIMEQKSETPKVIEPYKTPLVSLEANDEYCDMV
jgi:hypothetical protein